MTETGREGTNSSTHIHDSYNARVALVSELKPKTKGFGVFWSVGGNSFHTGGEQQESVFPAHAYAHESCFCNHLSSQLSWDLGKEPNAG